MAKLSRPPAMIGSAPHRLKSPPKHVDEFYRSPEWRRLVKQIKKERGAYCVVCGSTKRLIADHITEIKDGGVRLDANNIELLCSRHHNIKTAQRRKERDRGQV